MNSQNSSSPLVAVVGPTASGKSALGVWLAEQLGGEVVACDSTQLYRGFDVGTAKPTVAERHGVPHHLIDVLGPQEASTAGGDPPKALPALPRPPSRARHPGFTGGTRVHPPPPPVGPADRSPRPREPSRPL